MGEAKRRGNREQRLAQAKARGEFSLSKMEEWVNLPVDEDLFLFCSNLYTAGAQMSMPVENPESKTLQLEGGGEISFTDTPVNRGMGAVMKELNEQGVDEPTRFSISYRIMHLGSVLEETERFAKWIRPGEGSGEINVAEALLRACARAKINTADENGLFDMADVALHAAEIESRIKGEDSIGRSATA